LTQFPRQRVLATAATYDEEIQIDEAISALRITCTKKAVSTTVIPSAAEGSRGAAWKRRNDRTVNDLEQSKRAASILGEATGSLDCARDDN
jgi:hypothetical protein